MRQRPDVFALIARQMRAIFADARHLMATDLAMGLVLARALQRRQRQLGKRFTMAHAPALSTLPHLLASPSAAQSASTVVLNERDAIIGSHDSATAPLSPPTAAAAATAATDTASVSDPAHIAASGAQPPLSVEAADDLAAARYYSKYAIGAYGWPLYVFMQPCSWCCGLAPACCLSGTFPRVIDDGDDDDDAVRRGQLNSTPNSKLARIFFGNSLFFVIFRVGYQRHFSSCL
jgi:hypothetical protein